MPIAVAPEDVPAARKAELLRELDQRGRAMGDEIAQLTASYAEARRVVTIANSDGLFTGDDRTRTRIGVQTVARRGDKVETGAETLGAHRGFELLEDDPGLIAEQAAQKALTLLAARPAPSGSMPVVVGGGFGGVLFHEMTGHGLEIDHIHKGASRLRRQARRAGRPAAAERLRRRPPPERVGLATRSTTRASRPRKRW